MAFEIDPIIASFADPSPGAAVRPSEAWVEKFTGTSRIIAEDLAAIGAAADDDLVIIPDGRKILAVEYVALMTFAYANPIGQWNLWSKVKRSRGGHVTAIGNFVRIGATDISALAACSMLKKLILPGNLIADISALERCSQLRKLWLGSNRISDISPLTSSAKLASLDLPNNKISDISPLARCSSLVTLNLAGNQIADVSDLATLGRLGWLYLSNNQISDISPLERCSQLQCVTLSSNPLAEGSEEVMLKLHERGVTVEH